MAAEGFRTKCRVPIDQPTYDIWHKSRTEDGDKGRTCVYLLENITTPTIGNGFSEGRIHSKKKGTQCPSTLYRSSHVNLVEW